MEASEPWTMDELHSEFSRMVQEALEAGHTLTARQIERVATRATQTAARSLYRDLMERAPDMLEVYRRETRAFEQRNFRRWRRALDLIDTLWVSCEEIGREFNRSYRPAAISDADHVFEAMTYLHAKALLVTAEIGCLLRGGFADGALSRWRTLHEISVIATLIRQEGDELAQRYLAHSRVQALIQLPDDEENQGKRQRLQTEVDHAIQKFGPELKRRNGWAVEITRQQNPTFEKMAEIAGKSDEKIIYGRASRHIHSNHQSVDEMLGMCEAREAALLAGPSNSGLVGPLTLTSTSLVEITALLLMTKPNMDRLAFVIALARMAARMNRLASGLERRTFQAAMERQARNRR